MLVSLAKEAARRGEGDPHSARDRVAFSWFSYLLHTAGRARSQEPGPSLTHRLLKTFMPTRKGVGLVKQSIKMSLLGPA
jgi:hypothetical protein